MIAQFDWLSDSTFQVVALGTTLLGLISGILGSLAVLRRQSLLGDAVSHAALPGVAIAFYFAGQQPLIYVLGAALSGWLAPLIVLQIQEKTRLSFDAALAGTLAVFFGFGLLLISWIKRTVPGAAQSGLEKYLLGQAATMLESDVWIISIFGFASLASLMLFWKEFKLLCFDPEYAAVIGYPVRWLDRFLMFLLVVGIVIGIQAVGVVLMSALIVAPAVAARQWSNRFGGVVLIAGLVGAASGFLGTVLSDRLSASGQRVATGPTIVLSATAIGLISFAIRAWLNRRALRQEVSAQ